MTNSFTAPSASVFANGPLVAAADFQDQFDRLKRWGRGAAPADPGGAPAAVTCDEVLAALATPRTGEVVSLSLPWDRTGGSHNPRPALHHMVDRGDVEAPEPSAHKDFIAIDYHGKAVSHLDALCHIGYRGELYGGVPTAEAFTSLGSSWGAVTELSTRLVLRGVLLDIPAMRDVDWLEPGTAVLAEDVLAAEQALGFTIRRSDAVLLRSGHHARRATLGPWDADAASAGLHVDAMPLLAERGIA
ncbi:cyclase family protein, partial [Frankia sp. Cr1]|uniref:cyclase family protein n=1 Tax=Frankia sp. Cr1 TaxID=3073931 RepID=UPI002AD2DFF4